MKLYFFDFGGTLCAHDYVRKADGDLSYEDECLCSLSQEAFREEHKGDAPLGCMLWYVREKLRERNAMCFVLSVEKSNLNDAYNQDFVRRNYGGMGYLMVNEPLYKIDMIKAVARLHDVGLELCELVDDDMDVVYAANRAGITGKHLSNIVREHDLYQIRKAWEG